MSKRATISAVTGLALLAGAGALAVRGRSPAKPEGVQVVGQVVVEKLRGGEVYDADTVNKTLVAVGIRHMIACFIGDSANHFDTASYIAVGKSGTATDTTMTSLQAATKYWGNVDSITKAANWVKSWRTFTTAEANDTWKEIGWFSDSAGILLDRGVYTGWGVKTTADTFRASVKLSFQ